VSNEQTREQTRRRIIVTLCRFTPPANGRNVARRHPTPFYHSTSRLCARPFPTCNARHGTMRFRDQISRYSARSSKIDTSLCKLRTAVTSLVDVPRPFIITNRDCEARPYPTCTAQHHTAPFHDRFRLFRREHKNRHITLQTS